MLHAFREWQRRRILRRHAVRDPVWRAAVQACTLAKGFTPGEIARLRDLTTLFLGGKRFYGGAGLEVTAQMRLSIAIQAAVPILNLDSDWYRGWSSVIVYPGAFVARREERDEAGVVHRTHHALTGEAWDRGPLILSWEDAHLGDRPFGSESNVVVHECAHKLDMLDGSTNGHPPLHRGMDPQAWSEALMQAYGALRSEIASGITPSLDPYGAENPAEFFAIASEAFFGAPARLLHFHPGVYRQFQAFYRQDPATRRAGAREGPT